MYIYRSGGGVGGLQGAGGEGAAACFAKHGNIYIYICFDRMKSSFHRI